MRRILLLATVAVMMAAMLAVTAGAASATIHRLSCSEHSADSADGTAAGTSNPPGITSGDDVSGSDPDKGPASKPANTVTANQDPAHDEGTDDDNSNALPRGGKDCEGAPS